MGLTGLGQKFPVGATHGGMADQPTWLDKASTALESDKAGWPYGPTLAAVAVDSVAWPPGRAYCRLNRATGGYAKKNVCWMHEGMHACIHAHKYPSCSRKAKKVFAFLEIPLQGPPLAL